MPFNASKTI